MSTAPSIAAAWRESQLDVTRRSRGVVLIWAGEVYGWKDRLRDAVHERPGALAVDTSGHVYEAQGGNDQDGARAWVVLNQQGEGPAR